MKTKTLLAVLFVGISAIFTDLKAQVSIVIIEKPFIAAHLSGTVVNQLSERMPNVTVFQMTKGWKVEIQSTKTNNKGFFSFKNLPAGLYYLKFEADGFNPLKVKVILNKHSKARLKFTMEIGT